MGYIVAYPGTSQNYFQSFSLDVFLSNMYIATPYVTNENVDGIIKDEVGKVFVKVLEHAGVYKCDEEGRKAFRRFTDSVK